MCIATMIHVHVIPVCHRESCESNTYMFFLIHSFGYKSRCSHEGAMMVLAAIKTMFNMKKL
jgi:hypothetical protein